jgi:hypothetical protein
VRDGVERGFEQLRLVAIAAAMIDTLLWWARVAKEGRERHPLPGR